MPKMDTANPKYMVEIELRVWIPANSGAEAYDVLCRALRNAAGDDLEYETGAYYLINNDGETEHAGVTSDFF